MARMYLIETNDSESDDSQWNPVALFVCEPDKIKVTMDWCYEKLGDIAAKSRWRRLTEPGEAKACVDVWGCKIYADETGLTLDWS